MIDEDERAFNEVEAKMNVGARIQRFHDLLWETLNEIKEWETADGAEEALKRAKEDLLYDLLDSYGDLFDKIIAWKR